MLPLVCASVALYGATAALLLAAAHRWVWPVRKRVALVLALLPLLFTGRATLTGGVYAPVDILFGSEPFASRRAELGISRVQTPLLSDVVSSMIPWQKAVREAVTEGRLPVWNRFVLGGEPLLAVQQPAVLHPGTWLSLALPLAQGWTFQMSLRLLIALLAMYLFLLDVGCRDAAALLGAAAWAFSDFLIFNLGYPLANSIGPYPLLTLGLRRLANGRGADGRTAGGVALTTCALVLIVAAGHPETLLFSVAGAGVFFLFELAHAGRGRRLRPVLLSVVAGAAALGLTAVQLLPLFELVPRTWEHQFRSVFYAHAIKSVSLVESGRRALPFLVPYAYGSSGHGALAGDSGLPAIYAGSILFPLAAVGLLGRGRIRWALLVPGILGVLLWMRFPVVTDAVAHLPLFDMSVLDYLVFVGLFALCGLAALGTERLARGEGAVAFLSGATLAAAAILVVFRFRRPGMAALALTPEFLRARLFWELAPLAAAGAIVAALRPGAREVRAAPLLLAVLLVSRIGEAGAVYPTYPASAFYPHVPLFDEIRRDVPERFVGTDYMLVPNSSALYELEDVRGYESLTLLELYQTFPLWCVPQSAWYNRVDDLEKPFLSFLNVRYAIVPRGHRVPAGWTRIAQDPGGDLLENRRVLPRVFVPNSLCYERSPSRHFDWLARISDFAEWGVIGAASPSKEQFVKNGSARVGVIDYHEQALSAQIEAQQDCVVGSSITAWPGWQASLDGHAIAPLSYNHAFLGFRVPAGRHRLELRYLPDGFRAGAAISIATAALIVAGVTIRRRRMPDEAR